MSKLPFAYIVFDGERLTTDTSAPGRRLRIDARCLEGESVEDAYAHACALTNPQAQIPYDEPEVQGVWRDAMGWSIPLLGDSLICLSSLATDVVSYAGLPRSRAIQRALPRTRSRAFSPVLRSRSISSARSHRPRARSSSATQALPGPPGRSVPPAPSLLFRNRITP